MIPVRWSRYEGIRQVAAGTGGSRVERPALLITANLTGFHFADAMGKLAKAEVRQRGRHRARSGHGKASVHHDANGRDC
jgi:hypothetical protein